MNTPKLKALKSCFTWNLLVKMLIVFVCARKHTHWQSITHTLAFHKLYANSQTDLVINPIFPIVVCWWQTPNQLFHKILCDKMWQTIVVLCLYITLILFLSLSASPSLHPHSPTTGDGLSTDRGEHTHTHTQSCGRLCGSYQGAKLCGHILHMCVFPC